VRKAKDTPGLVGRDLVTNVTCREPYAWEQGPWKLGGYLTADEISTVLGRPPLKVVAYDFGIKWNILRNLVGVGCAVRVVPASTPAREVLALRPDGVFLSHGPGDPDAVAGAPENMAPLLGEVPVFGICLGHRDLGLGGGRVKTSSSRASRRQPAGAGSHHGKVEITAQNHGFVVDGASLGDRAR
jgi:carbamoyl-phosphate synthase small subunit